MAKQVKTYRALRDNMKVGDSVRNFGDPIPEAAEWGNLRTYLNSGVVEEIYMDEDNLATEMDRVAKADEERLAALRNPTEDEVEEIDLPNADDAEPGDETVTPPVVKKKTVKKKPAAKKTTKKTVKKGKSSERSIAEVSV